MATKRKIPTGWQYRITRAKLLDKPIYLNFTDEVEGDAYVAKLEAMLDRGIVPPEISKKGEGYSFLGELLTDYMTQFALPDSDKALLNTIYARLGTTRLQAIDYAWVEEWIFRMKVELNLAPGTIRHHVGALGRCFDWAGNRNVVPLVINPIRRLPKNYASYSERDAALAKEHNEKHKGRRDQERERRLLDGEDERIRAIINNAKPKHRERPMRLEYPEAHELIYDLALETAMRLSEIFTLTVDQVDLNNATIFLDRSKNGNKRQVPLSSVAIEKLRRYLALVKNQEGGMKGFEFDRGQLLPFWDGVQSAASRKKYTDRLSQRFGRIFENAECKDLNFHDLRHEATSRFFERTQLSEFEIMKITGHSSTRMLKRYANLRASHLSKKLW